MNVDKIRKELNKIHSQSCEVNFQFFSIEIIEKHADLFWKFIDASSAFDDPRIIHSLNDVTEDVYAASKKIDTSNWIEGMCPTVYKDDGSGTYVKGHFSSDGNLAIQISFIMEMFKFGNITDSVDYLIYGRKEDKKIFAGVLTVNSDGMSYKEFRA